MALSKQLKKNDQALRYRFSVFFLFRTMSNFTWNFYPNNYVWDLALGKTTFCHKGGEAVALCDSEL